MDELGRARVDKLRAQIAYSQSRGSDAAPLLLRAAKRLERLDARLARATYLDALSAGIFGGTGGVGVAEVAKAALAAPPPSTDPQPSDLLLEGIAIQHTTGYAAGVPTLKRALTALRTQEMSSEDELRCSWLAYRSAGALWDDETWDVLANRYVKLAREAGALPILQLGLTARMSLDAFAGELSAAAQAIEELRAVTEAMGSDLPPDGPLLIAAWKGRYAESSEVVEAAMRDLAARGEAFGLATAQWATAVLGNGLGRHEEALAAAERASQCREAHGLSNWSLVEMIEAAVRSGQPERAADALDRLSATTQISGSEWALGIEARSRALLSTDEVADSLYREAVDRLGRTRVRVELARAHLLYGEWLRRERRRIDARQQLRAAHEMLSAMGVEAFAERARRELMATGETVRKRTAETRDDLTAQEREIARLARDGLSNPEIGARLFISRRTVQYHLRKVFAKLEITSRAELQRALPSDSATA